MLDALAEFLFGIAVIVLLGSGVETFLKKVIPQPECPKALKKEAWDALSKRVHTGSWIGLFERLLSLVAFWIPAYEILAGWLVLKVAAKWESWRNVIQIPSHLRGVSDVAWLEGRVAYGSWLLSRFLVGTLLSVLIGAIGAYAGKHFWKVVDWVAFAIFNF